MHACIRILNHIWILTARMHCAHGLNSHTCTCMIQNCLRVPFRPATAVVEAVCRSSTKCCVCCCRKSSSLRSPSRRRSAGQYVMRLNTRARPPWRATSSRTACISWASILPGGLRACSPPARGPTPTPRRSLAQGPRTRRAPLARSRLWI